MPASPEAIIIDEKTASAVKRVRTGAGAADDVNADGVAQFAADAPLEMRSWLPRVSDSYVRTDGDDGDGQGSQVAPARVARPCGPPQARNF